MALGAVHGPRRGGSAATAAVDAVAAVADATTAIEAGKQAGHAAAPPSGGASALAQLVTLIPTETLIFYVAVETALGEPKAPTGGLVCQAGFGARWWWLLGLFVLTIALAIGLSYRKQKEANASAPFRFPWAEVLAASAGFLIGVLSLPSTPLRDSVATIHPTGVRSSCWVARSLSRPPSISLERP
ncbi:hypothetical protein [Streptomyces sp. ISL-98]|uniref:hypothetical protein n=1 Tax=Streptomyces sp. ISL-98 TaxID=2819192 RepID=UPI002035E736|nr:hypothetical protein [Streptomyces sp. ISL-98]